MLDNSKNQRVSEILLSTMGEEVRICKNSDPKGPLLGRKIQTPLQMCCNLAGSVGS